MSIRNILIPNQEQTFNITEHIESSPKLLPQNNNSINTDLNDLSVQEINRSFDYKFIFNLDLVASNVLASWNEGQYSWANLIELATFDDDDQDYDFSPDSF